MCEEIFGPVITAYAYDDARWEETLGVIDRTSRTRSPARCSRATAAR
jgi:acyl-CoA reductase-like NAD-dependent aldehyde dehydrogenase